jgi:hypothetical protein
MIPLRKNRLIGYKTILLGFLAAIVFLIAQPALAQTTTVTLVKPNGGECLKPGTTTTVEWRRSGTYGDFYHLALINEDGSKWRVFVSWIHINTTTYQWTVPDAATVTSWGLDPNKVKVEVILWSERDVPGGDLPYQKIFREDPPPCY